MTKAKPTAKAKAKKKRDERPKRACRVTFKFVTAKKKKAIKALLKELRRAINFYIKSIWKTPGKLDNTTIERLPETKTRLSANFRACALKIALATIVSTKLSAKKAKKRCKCPVFTGSVTLHGKLIRVEEGEGSFDLVLRLSSLKKRQLLALPTKHTKMTRKWLKKRGAKLVQGCSLDENGVTIFISLPKPKFKAKGKILAVDLGVNKIFVDSEGNQYGKEFKAIRDKIYSCEKGSKAQKRAYKERDCYLRHIINQLPWDELQVLGVEDLKGMKQGKSKKRGKSFRRAIAPWTYSQVLTWVKQKAQENRVRLVSVNPVNTSRKCPNPKCNKVHEMNRKGEKFECLACGYKADADFVGALNILAKTLRFLGSLGSPSSLETFLNSS